MEQIPTNIINNACLHHTTLSHPLVSFAWAQWTFSYKCPTAERETTLKYVRISRKLEQQLRPNITQISPNKPLNTESSIHWQSPLMKCQMASYLPDCLTAWPEFAVWCPFVCGEESSLLPGKVLTGKQNKDKTFLDPELESLTLFLFLNSCGIQLMLLFRKYNNQSFLSNIKIWNVAKGFMFGFFPPLLFAVVMVLIFRSAVRPFIHSAHFVFVQVSNEWNLSLTLCRLLSSSSTSKKIHSATLWRLTVHTK